MIQFSTKITLFVITPLILILTLNENKVLAKESNVFNSSNYNLRSADSIEVLTRLNNPYLKMMSKDTIQLSALAKQPVISLQQMLKGNTSSVYVQEISGEPGVEQSMILRGLSSPIIHKGSVDFLQPQVYLNGIPLMSVNPFVYDIQQYTTNKIGPATNTFAGININNISSIEIIKDPLVLAKLGPLASNGAIWVLTKGAKAGESEISINAYTGVTVNPVISPTNAYYENLFRSQFYNKYATLDEKLKYPAFLADSTNTNYYGSSNWHKEYYKPSAQYNVDFGLSGGTERANFRFFGGHTRNSNSADETNLKGYNAAIFINMAPFEWWNISGMVNGTLNQRGRNKNMRDRLEETRYLPNLSIPIPPNADMYSRLMSEYEKAIDDNNSTKLQADILFTLNYDDWYLNTKLSYDYNEGVRNVFYPSTLLEGNNYGSRYFGYSERVRFNTSLNKTFSFDESSVRVEFGQALNFDVYKYNYAYGYRGPSDFIKAFVVSGNSSAEDYLKPNAGEIYRNTDKQRVRLASYYTQLDYSLGNLLLKGLLRFDGASNMQPDSRWLLSPALSAEYLFRDDKSSSLSFLKVGTSWSQFGKATMDDRFARGPQYRVDIGWENEINLPSFNGFAVMSRPYTQGWVGYDISWPISKQLDFSIQSKFFQNKLSVDLNVFQKDDVNQIMKVPVASEFGYTGAYLNGLDVRNRGVELNLNASIIDNLDGFKWNSNFNLNHTTNTLLALPNDLQDLVIGNRYLKVGSRIDNFWLLEGKGAYNSISEIPVFQGDRLSADGVALSVGDPKWLDKNNDGRIDNDDRVLKGQSMPKFFGGFNNTFSYKKWSLNLDLYFALGHSTLNQRASNVYDFVNLESKNDINSVREIYFWQQDVDISKYPIYNPWSGVNPYRLQQDLFLEKLDYAKLRSMTVSYNFNTNIGSKGLLSKLKQMTVYMTGYNLYTISSFSGVDPELSNLEGIYSGFNFPLAKSFTLGVQIKL